jgi:hypothetical protein
MKRLGLTLLLGMVILFAGIYGTAALTSVTIDRSVEASIAADNSTAAVKLECVDNSAALGTNYTPLCIYTNGVLTLELHRAVDSTGTIGFNPDAIFVVGAAAADSRVLRITNNSGISIKVQMPDVSDILMKLEVTGATVNTTTPHVLTAGTSAEFFFQINTPASLTTPLTATLQIREN